MTEAERVVARRRIAERNKVWGEWGEVRELRGNVGGRRQQARMRWQGGALLRGTKCGESVRRCGRGHEVLKEERQSRCDISGEGSGEAAHR